MNLKVNLFQKSSSKSYDILTMLEVSFKIYERKQIYVQSYRILSFLSTIVNFHEWISLKCKIMVLFQLHKKKKKFFANLFSEKFS